MLRQVPAITELAQLDPTGKEQLRVSRLVMDLGAAQTDYSQAPKFTEAVAKKVYYGPVYFRRESEPYMTLSLAGTRRDAGVSVAEVNLKLIWDVVSQIKVGEHGVAYVVDGDGRLIAHPDISLVLRNTDMTRLAQVAVARSGEAGSVQEEYRWADDHLDRLPQLAADLVRRAVSLIATPVASGALAAKAATTKIPIVFYSGPDPVEIGLVTSLNRPNGNLTGVGSMNSELTAKRLKLLQGLRPGSVRFAVLNRPSEAFAGYRARELQSLAAVVGQSLSVLNVDTGEEIEAAFDTLAHNPVDGLLVSNNILFLARRVQLAVLAASHRVPTIYAWRESVEAGGLISYGTRILDLYVQTGIYAGRILNGEKPADLPVMEPNRFELVINLNAANALGLTIPETLLATADEVIE